MLKKPGLATNTYPYHGLRGPALAGSAGIIVLIGIASVWLAGCDPLSDGDPMPGGEAAASLSGCWTVHDTAYIEAGRTSYDTGTLVLSQHGAVLAGEIDWNDSAKPSDSLSGLRKGDSLSLTLREKGFPEGPALTGTILDGNRFHVAFDRMGSGTRFSAFRLAKCPDPQVANPNPRMLRLQATSDSIAVSHVDSVSLNAFASYAYFGDSDVVRFSEAYDTLTFTYRSYQDRVRASKSISGAGFSLLTTPQGEKLIYGSVYPYFNDGLMIRDSTEYSLNENVVIPGGLPKGKYKLVIRLQVGCFCIPRPSDFYVKEFTIE
jgi:hypothetical protein